MGLVRGRWDLGVVVLGEWRVVGWRKRWMEVVRSVGTAKGTRFVMSAMGDEVGEQDGASLINVLGYNVNTWVIE